MINELSITAVISLHMLPMYSWIFFRYSSFLPQTQSMHLWFIGDWKLSLGLSEHGNVFMNLISLHVALCWTCNLSRVYPTSHTVNAGNRQQLLHDSKRKRDKGNRWMSGWSWVWSKFLEGPDVQMKDTLEWWRVDLLSIIGMIVTSLLEYVISKVFGE